MEKTFNPKIISLSKLQDMIIEYFKININDFIAVNGCFNLPRLIFCFMSYKIYGYKLTEIANHSGVNANSISSVLSRQKSILNMYSITDEIKYKKPELIISEIVELFLSLES